MRQYDYVSAQRVDQFVANSKEVQARIKKFYGRDSVVVYPPAVSGVTVSRRHSDTAYYLTGGRLVGAKHFDLVIEAANQLQVPLKIYGDGPLRKHLMQLAGKTVEFVGHVDQAKLMHLYESAQAFVALAQDEDFGITPVEAMSVGTPVLAFRGGGFIETVIEGKTGLFVDDLRPASIVAAMKRMQSDSFDREVIIKHAKQFNKDAFIAGMRTVIEQAVQQKK
jgi:glycosyltransferase involved in cell wall biosynthesis